MCDGEIGWNETVPRTDLSGCCRISKVMKISRWSAFVALRHLIERGDRLMFPSRRQPRRGENTNAHSLPSVPSRNRSSARPLLAAVDVSAHHFFRWGGVPCSSGSNGAEPWHHSRSWSGSTGPDG